MAPRRAREKTKMNLIYHQVRANARKRHDASQTLVNKSLDSEDEEEEREKKELGDGRVLEGDSDEDGEEPDELTLQKATERSRGNACEQTEKICARVAIDFMGDHGRDARDEDIFGVVDWDLDYGGTFKVPDLPATCTKVKFGRRLATYHKGTWYISGRHLDNLRTFGGGHLAWKFATEKQTFSLVRTWGSKFKELDNDTVVDEAGLLDEVRQRRKCATQNVSYVFGRESGDEESSSPEDSDGSFELSGDEELMGDGYM